jgi:hypothetical protein
VTKTELEERFLLIRNPNAGRLAMVFMAFNERMDADARNMALAVALNITPNALESAFEELDRVGIGKIEWTQ